MKQKKSLALSALSLLLCGSIAVGGTFALFTSEANVNIAVQSGKIKVTATTSELNVFSPVLIEEDGSYDKSDDNNGSENGSFVNGGGAKMEGNVITLDKMMPGDSVDFDITVVNESTVGAKYRTVVWAEEDSVVAGDSDDGISFDGISFFERMNVTVDGKSISYTAYTDWTYIAPGAEEIVIPVSIELPGETGNAYQAASAKIGFKVEAIQSNANVKNVVNVESQEELTEAIEESQIGDVISLASGTYTFTENLKTNGSFEVEEGAQVTIELDGSKLTTTTSSEVNAPTIVNSGDLTIVDGSITNNNATNAANKNVAAIHNAGGTLTLKGCTIANTSPTSGGAYCVVIEGGKVILDNCTVSGNRGGIAISGDGSIEMVGGSVTAGKYYPLCIGGTGNSSFENVTFSQTGGKSITYNVLSTGAATFRGCTFKTTKAVNFDVYKVTTGFTFNSCTFTNVNSPIA